MTLKVRHTLGLHSGADEFKQAWDQLFAVSSNPVFYNDWRWHQNLALLLLHDPVYYFGVYESDQLIAVVPLTVTTRVKGKLKIRVLGFPHDVVADLTDLVLHKDKTQVDIFGAVLDYIRRHQLLQWEMLELSRFNDRSGTRALLTEAQIQPLGTSAYTCAQGEGLIAPLSKKQIKNVQRHARNAEQVQGAPRLEQVCAPAAIEEAYFRFLDIEQAGWKGTEGTQSAIRLRPAACAFYLEVLRTFAQSGRAVINLLHFGDTPAAAQMGLRTGDQLCLLKIGYDERFRDLGPGGIALLKCLALEEARNTSEVCLVTDPPWADRWHFARQTTWTHTRFNTSLYGRLLAMAQRLRLWWRGRKAAADTPNSSNTAESEN